MSRTRKAAFLLVWFVIATHLYAYLWTTHLDYFPQPPEEFGMWAIRITGANNEDIEQLTLYYIFIFSFIVVVAATLLGAVAIWGYRNFRKSR